MNKVKNKMKFYYIIGPESEFRFSHRAVEILKKKLIILTTNNLILPISDQPQIPYKNKQTDRQRQDKTRQRKER